MDEGRATCAEMMLGSTNVWSQKQPLWEVYPRQVAHICFSLSLALSLSLSLFSALRMTAFHQEHSQCLPEMINFGTADKHFLAPHSIQRPLCCHSLKCAAARGSCCGHVCQQKQFPRKKHRKCKLQALRSLACHNYLVVDDEKFQPFQQLHPLVLGWGIS